MICILGYFYVKHHFGIELSYSIGLCSLLMGIRVLYKEA